MEEKKHMVIKIMPILVVLILLVVGTTYAYYVVSSTNDTSTARYDVTNKPLGAVTFSSKVTSLKMKITPTDMAKGYIGNKYYAVTPDVAEDRGSLFKKEAQNHEIVRGTVKGTTTEERYICEGTLKIEVSNTMYKVLQKGDVKLILTASNAKIDSKESITLDISDVKNGIQTYPVKFATNKDNDTMITADVVMENRDADQSDIAGNELDINITLEDKPSCHIEVGDEMVPAIITQLREQDKSNQLTKDLVGGMYRYQGTDEVNNWICFGTTNKEECTKGGDNYGDGIDKYMYRIMGVTPDGQLALIKETGVKEGSTVNFYWNAKYRKSECGTNGENCTWENSRIYNRLNGLCNINNKNCTGTSIGDLGTSNIFLNSIYYDYLKDNTWLEKINTHTWKYGDTEDNGNYNGDDIYKIENEFANNVEAKIGLQYIHDYYYAYPDGKPGNYSKGKNAWIHLLKDGYNTGRISNEWLISRYGVYYTLVYEWTVDSDGYVYDRSLGYSYGARPVFYLKSDIQISNTAGSKGDPFMITN